MSSLICFPNKLEKPDCGVRGEFAFAGSGSKPAENGAAGEGADFMGASCSPDPGNEAAGECGKRISDSSRTSEDLSCSSKIKGDVTTSRGSPEWTGVDSQRAISLDASECQTEISNQSLVRSMALEDLTSIDGGSLWVNRAEEIISEQTKDGAAFASCTDSRNKNIIPETQQPPHCSDLLRFDSQSDDLHTAYSWRNVSMKDSLFTKMPSGWAAENSSSDSSLHTASHSKPDISDDSETRSNVVQTTGTAELLKTTPQTSPARKSLVLVPVFTGLFVMSPLHLTSSTSFIYKRSFSSVLCCTLPPNSSHGRYNPRTSLLASLPTLAFGFIAPSLPHSWSCSPQINTFGFVFHKHFCVAVHAASPRDGCVCLP